ncbi:MAG TPA: hypothetical protein VMW65_01745 [Chloroflexota bacterium]|nr:hypothetical protein [Chloroflexota bacterium]
MVARLFLWLFISAILLVLFIFSRRRFRQVMWMAGLSIVSGVILRLFSLGGSDIHELIDESYFIVAIAVFYGVVWLGVRYLGSNEHAAKPPPPRRRQR